jgi:hypothetical protein
VEKSYFHCSDFEEGTCVTDLRIFYPDFLVANSGDLHEIGSGVSTMGMKEVARFLNGINGIQLSNGITFGEEAFSDNIYTKLPILSGLVVLSLDEFVLFQNNLVKPRY